MLTKIKYLTAGESHGKGLLGIIDGIPAGLEISEDYIGQHLYRRQQGHGRGGRMKIEQDRADGDKDVDQYNLQKFLILRGYHQLYPIVLYHGIHQQ
jgi:hypothetical protein